jgi:hypothetical protein
LIRDTGELSDDFLANADNLAETFEGDVTYDQWLNIQREVNRPRSLDEEVPDLLEDTGAPAVSPFPQGSMKLPDTGELPDWFLGLEELDDNQAPAWFKENPAAAQPPPPPPPPAAAPVPPPITQPTVNPLDDFFAGITAQRGSGDTVTPPDMLAAVFQPDLDDSREMPPLSGNADPELDDFFASVGTTPASVPDDEEELPDLLGNLDRSGSIPADDFFLEFADPASAPTMPRPSRPLEPELLNFDFGEDTDEITPIPPPPPRQRDARLDFEFDAEHATPPPVPTPPQPLTITPAADVSPESLDWLNEINSMIDSVVDEEANEDSDEFYPQAVASDFFVTGDTSTLKQRPQQAPTFDENPPDWLTQLQAMPDHLPEEADTSVSPASNVPMRGEQPRANPLIDFTDFDAVSFGADAAQTAAPGQSVTTDPFANLFADIGTSQTQNDPTAMREAEPKRKTAGATVILPEDAPIPVIFDVVEQDSVSVEPDLDRLAALRTDEVEAALFTNNPALDTFPPVEDYADIAQVIHYAPAEPAAPPEDSAEFFELMELTDDFIPPLDQRRTTEEDMSWLQDVRFDDDPTPAPAQSAPAAAQVMQMPTLPTEAPPEDASTQEMAQFFASLQVSNDPAPFKAEPAADVQPTSPPVHPPATPAPPARETRSGTTEELHLFYTGFLNAANLPDAAPASPPPPPPVALASPARVDFDHLDDNVGFMAVQPEIYTGALAEEAPVPADTPQADNTHDDALAALFGELSGDTATADMEVLAPSTVQYVPASAELPAEPPTTDELNAFEALFGQEAAQAPSPAQSSDNYAFGIALGALEAQDTDADLEFDALFTDTFAQEQPLEEVPRFAANTGELTALFDDIADDLMDVPSIQPEEEARFAANTGELTALFDAPLPEAETGFAANTGELNAFFDAVTDLPADELPTEPGFATNTGELNALFGDTSSTLPSSEQDMLAGLFDNPLLPQADQTFDDLFADLQPLPADAMPAQARRFAADTGELGALFGDDDETDEPPAIANPQPPRAAIQTFAPEEPADLTEFDLILAGLDAPGAPQNAQERLMPERDDFDALFDDMDDGSSTQSDTELPGTGTLAGFDQSLGDESIPASEDDLEALFAAYEQEQRTTPDTPAIPNDLDFPDDDSFFAALGLEEAPPAPPSPPAPDDDLPDTDYLRGFSQPEVSNTTYTSGDNTASMWEDEQTEVDPLYEDLPQTPAFDFEAEPEPVPDSFDQPVSDWFAETPAPTPATSAADWDTQAVPKTAPIVEEAMPEWLKTMDDLSGEIELPPAPTPPPAPINLDSYLAGLDRPENVLPQSGSLAAPIVSTDEIDIDALFTDTLPEATQDDRPAEEPLTQADMLGELQASVGAVSATAMARQLSDKPEQELSDRLQKLRQRATDEMLAVDVPTPADDSMKDVLPGLSDTLAPAPVVTEVSGLIGGAVLNSLQQQHVSLLRDMLGLRDAPAPVRGQKLSAIDLTYEAPHLQEDASEFNFEEEAPAQPVSLQPAAVPISAPVQKRQRIYRIDRLILSLLLVAGMTLPFLVSETRFGELPPAAFAANSDENAAFEQIERLQQYDLVLVALEYGPAAAGEMDSMTEAMLRHILLRGARPIFISGNPFGVLRAQTFIDTVNADTEFLRSMRQRVPLEANVEYFISRFLPGSAVGLRAFSESTADLLTVEINGQTIGLNLESLSNLSLILLLTDRAEDVRAYAEQIAPLAGRPLVVAVNYTSAPLAEPYAALPASIRGFLSGYGDAITYQQMLGSVEIVERGSRPIIPQALTSPEPQAPAQATPEASGTPGTSDATGTPESTSAPAASPTGLTAIVVSADGANLRAGPGTDFTRVIGLARNTVLSVLGFNDDGEWVNVRTEDGTVGWVSAGLVVVSEAEADADPVATPTASALLPASNGSARLAQQGAEEPLLAEEEAAGMEAYRWYAMNIGIILSIVIIALGAVLGVLRGLVRRRSRT